eukprot:3844546-Rhodomonas_salina.1
MNNCRSSKTDPGPSPRFYTLGPYPTRKPDDPRCWILNARPGGRRYSATGNSSTALANLNGAANVQNRERDITKPESIEECHGVTVFSVESQTCCGERGDRRERGGWWWEREEAGEKERRGDSGSI